MNITIANNVALLPNGKSVDLAHIEAVCSQYPAAADAFALLTGRAVLRQSSDAKHGAGRVIIIVDGGVADFVSDVGVEVRIFDRDNAREGDVNPVPASWADLAGPANVPYSLGSDSQVGVEAGASQRRLRP